MSETISAAEANRQFSKILRAVEAGESFTVTSHGRAVARICPIGESDQEAQARRRAALTRLLERLRQQPAMNLGKWTRDELYER
jgi:prevent-host-death family protein